MSSSDDDGEILPEVVSDYYFFDADDEPVSFIELPVEWSNGERSDDNKSKMYLRGKTDNDLQRVHKEVKAWKYEFLKEKPEILVLSKDNKWIKIQKPRKSHEIVIRTILITVHCLHFFWRKPKASSKALRDHLCKVFSLYDIRPSENDLKDHLDFIQEAVKRDKTLQKSKFLASLLEGRSSKTRAFDKSADAIMKPSFIVDMVCKYEDDKLPTKGAEESESESDDDDNDLDFDDDEDQIFDTVCAICDNGGDLTCCDGKCFRSFHATVKSAKSAKSNCKSLGLHAEEVKGSEPFFCLNCSHEQHQCFVCGELGSSKKYSAEVFWCNFENCGHFYHPNCVAKLLEDKSDTEARYLEEKIASDEPFTCPAHRCHKCKLGEDENVKALQFAVCRRCPRSYHRKCLPSKIVFDNKHNAKDVTARAWNGLLPKSRALIYCLKHNMDDEVGTAVRNIKFPEISHKEDTVNSDYESDKPSVKKPVSSVRPVYSCTKRAATLSRSEPAHVKKQRVSVTYKKALNQNLSIDAERYSKKEHFPVDEYEETPIEANSRDRLIVMRKDPFLDMNERLNNLATRDPCGIPSDDKTRLLVGAAHEHSDDKTRKLITARHGYNGEDYKEIRKCALGRRTEYIAGHHDSGFSSRYQLTGTYPSSCNRSSTYAINKYTPRLDELNHTWKRNRGMEVYDHPVAQPMPHVPTQHMDRLQPSQHRHARPLSPGSPHGNAGYPSQHHSARHQAPHHRVRHHSPDRRHHQPQKRSAHQSPQRRSRHHYPHRNVRHHPPHCNAHSTSPHHNKHNLFPHHNVRRHPSPSPSHNLHHSYPHNSPHASPHHNKHPPSSHHIRRHSSPSPPPFPPKMRHTLSHHNRRHPSPSPSPQKMRRPSSHHIRRHPSPSPSPHKMRRPSSHHIRRHPHPHPHTRGADHRHTTFDAIHPHPHTTCTTHPHTITFTSHPRIAANAAHRNTTRAIHPATTISTTPYHTTQGVVG